MLGIKYNIVFLPISLVNGMAASKRLRNFYIHLKEIKDFSILNIVHENNVENIKTTLEQKNIDDLNYNIIRYNFRRLFAIFKVIYLTNKLLKNHYNNGCINILHNTGYPNIRNIAIILFAKIIGYKLIFDILEDNSAIYKFKSQIHRLKNASSILLFKYIYLFANGIVCISDFLYKKTCVVAKGRVPIVLIPGSYDERLFIPDTEKLKSQKGISIFYGGSFGEKDGLEYLFTAFDLLAEDYDLRLIITGKGSDHDTKNFISQLHKLKFKDRIEYMGYLNDSEYYKILQEVDIFCMVRVKSNFANAGFPFKLAEILATGKPVIATKVSVVEQYLGKNDAFLIDPERTDEIVKAVKYIIDNPLIAKKVGENGKRVAQKNFSSKKIAKDFMDFIQFEVK